MELNLLKETEMPLLSRKRINIEVSFEGATPSKKEILTNLANKLKTKEDLIHIRHIYTKYGTSKAKVIAHLYNKVEDLKDIEEIKKKKKKVQTEQQQKAEAPKQEQHRKETKEVKSEEEKKEVKQYGKEEKKE